MTKTFSEKEFGDALDFFHKNGYVALEGTYNDHLLDKTKNSILDLIESERNQIHSTTYNDYGFLLCAAHYADKHPHLIDILENDLLLQFTELIMQKWFILYLYSNNCIPPNNSSKAARIHVDTPRYIKDFIPTLGVMITLDDYNELNGATWVLPNSHDRLEEPTEEEFYKNAIRLIIPKGSVCFFNPRMWHAAGANHSDKWRSCLLLAFCKPWMKQRVDIPKFMSHINTTNYSQRLKQLLGYNSIPPGNFNEFYGEENGRTYTQPFV